MTRASTRTPTEAIAQSKNGVMIGATMMPHPAAGQGISTTSRCVLGA
jgi:hypothetical protein